MPHLSLTADPYRVLGVSPQASGAEIKAAYRTLVKQHHPDAGVVAGVAKGLEQFRDGVGREGVTPVGAVDGHPGDAFGLLVDDVLEVPGSFPSDFGLHAANLQEPPTVSND